MAKLYVGNIPYSANEADIRAFFGNSSKITLVKMIGPDRETNRPRGFCFVETITDDDARIMSDTFDGRELMGRFVRVSQAKPREGTPVTAKRYRSDRPEDRDDHYANSWK